MTVYPHQSICFLDFFPWPGLAHGFYLPFHARCTCGGGAMHNTHIPGDVSRPLNLACSVQLTSAAITHTPFFTPGSDTTASTLGFLLYELGRHPGAQQRAAAEVDAALGGKEPGELRRWCHARLGCHLDYKLQRIVHRRIVIAAHHSCMGLQRSGSMLSACMHCMRLHAGHPG
jgi:hypothetical protein